MNSSRLVESGMNCSSNRQLHIRLGGIDRTHRGVEAAWQGDPFGVGSSFAFAAPAKAPKCPKCHMELVAKKDKMHSVAVRIKNKVAEGLSFRGWVIPTELREKTSAALRDTSGYSIGADGKIKKGPSF